MRLKLFLLLLISATFPIFAQTVRLQGVVVDSSTGAPVNGATVTLRSQGLGAASADNGDFVIPGSKSGNDFVIISCDGYEPIGLDISVPNVKLFNIGEIRLVKKNQAAYDVLDEFKDMLMDENIMEDEDGNTQSVAALTGANDNIYFSEGSYNFSPMYFRFRGYDNLYQNVYINGVQMNDLMRGRFNFSMLMGAQSRAFRNRTNTIGLDAADYGFGGIGGSVNYNTTTETYAPGFYGSLVYTNSNYMLRALAIYSTGMNKNGWALTVAGIGRYADEGVIEGTFYNSGGLFLSLEKRLNPNHSLVLTAWGGPTQRATAKATYQEAYDLAGSNLYNPNWGYQDGKKRSSSIRESFDPTMMLNWLYRKENVSLNTAAVVRWVNYSSRALPQYTAPNPDPAYYKRLPSYWRNYLLNGRDWNEISEAQQSTINDVTGLYSQLWQDESFRQIDWESMYSYNYNNNKYNEGLAEADRLGSVYIMEDRHSNQFVTQFSSNLNTRLSDVMTLQAGVQFNYTDASYFKTIRDLLGGEFWVDIDPFNDDLATLDQDIIINDLNNPKAHARKGDRFGYDYNIYALQAKGWLQNRIVTPKWDVNYGLEIAYTQYQRDGHMRNGRAPLNSYGKSRIARFDDAAFKAGALYKLNGRNYFAAHAQFGTKAPVADNVFVAPRIKNSIIDDAKSERIFAADLGYIWNYRRFRGSITGFYTRVNDATEHFVFYDDNVQTNANFSLTGVSREYKGVELGAAYKITPSLTALAAASYASFLYKNNPTGTRNYENGMEADKTATVYLKNYHPGGAVPETNVNIGLDYAAPKNWFFDLNGTFQGNAYVQAGIPYHEELESLWQKFPDKAELDRKVAELTYQEKLRNAFTLNLSIGKAVYLKKITLNFNLNVYNLLNNKKVATWAYQQSRLDTKNYIADYYPNRYQYAQGIRMMFNVGVRF